MMLQNARKAKSAQDSSQLPNSWHDGVRLSVSMIIPRVAWHICPWCNSGCDIYLSRSQSVWERMAILLLLRPVRCHRCSQRHYRPLFVPTRPPQSILDWNRAAQRIEARRNKRRSA
jgi:hypothetical protein